ncbi:unnamed protein product [Peniophora sp. CBMAI 1063]|nr:unnamed protein product [Peniophora sp. CBMAI 1063]
MASDTSQLYWEGVFLERLQTLPDDIELLSSELQGLSRAYQRCCMGLNERVESLRHKPYPRRTTSPTTLPAEILLHIFHFLSQDEPIGENYSCRGRLGEQESETSDSDSDDSDSDTESVDSTDYEHQYCLEDGSCCLAAAMGWSCVSHVCSRWRSIAIGNATLWTDLPLNLSTPWVEEIIERSKNLPLNIIIPCDANWEAVEDVLSNHLPRIRSIELERGAEIVGTFLSRSPATQLESLHMEHNANHMALPDNMATSFPRLKRLSLQNVVSLPNFRGLAASRITHLTIMSVIKVPTKSQFYDLLRSLDGIQYLHLENCLPKAKTVSGQPIALSHLGTLIIRGPRRGCGALLHSLEYPSFASTTMYTLEDGSLETDADNYMRLSGLGTLLHNVGPAGLHSLHISTLEIRPQTWQFVVAGQRAPCDIGDYIHDNHRRPANDTGPSNHDLKMICTIPGQELANAVFAKIMADLMLPTLASLSLCVDSLVRLDQRPWNRERWVSVLRGANGVKHLQLISPPWRAQDVNEHDKPNPFVDLMCALTMSARCGYPPHTILPDLEKMTLVNIDSLATMTLPSSRIWYDGDEVITAEKVLRYFMRTRLNFDEWNLRVVYPDASWKSHYFTPTIRDDNGPLQAMVCEKSREQERFKEHVMIRSRVHPLGRR